MSLSLSRHVLIDFQQVDKFIEINVRDTAVEIADTFFEHIFKNSGLAVNIVSNRDTKFRSVFWRILLQKRVIQLRISTILGRQTDKALEMVNQMV